MFHHLLLPLLNHHGEAELQFQVNNNCLRGFNLVGLLQFPGNDRGTHGATDTGETTLSPILY